MLVQIPAEFWTVVKVGCFILAQFRDRMAIKDDQYSCSVLPVYKPRNPQQFCVFGSGKPARIPGCL